MGAVAVLVMGIGVAYANNPDAFLVTCTPSLIYAVTITTPAAGLTFPAVSTGTIYVNASTAVVTNSGNVSSDWTIKGTAVAGNVWQLGNTPASDTARLLVCLKNGIASSGDFTVNLDTISATEANMDNVNYAVGGQNGNGVPAAATRMLSMRLDSPTDSTVNTNQQFRIEIKAYPASQF